MECRYVGLRSAIRTALANCMVRLKHKKAFEEPDYTAGIVMSISDALNSSNQRWGLEFGGCFIHQSPRVTFDTGACELGDMLVVCHDVRDDRYNAVMLQLKNPKQSIGAFRPDAVQMHLYKDWPSFEWKKQQIHYSIEPKTMTPGALYGIIKPINQFGVSMAVAAPADIISVSGQPFEDLLYDVIDFRAGRTFVGPSVCTTDDWSRLMCDVCSWVKKTVYKRTNIYQHSQPRGYGSMLSFLADEQNSEAIKKLALEEVDIPTDELSAESEEKGWLGVLLIERM